MSTKRMCARWVLVGLLAAISPAHAGLKDALQTVRDAVPGQYIVAVDRGTDDATIQRLLTQSGGQLLHRYSTAFSGFALKAEPQAVLALLKQPKVRFVEQVGKVKLVSRPPWGLDRIDQYSLPMDGSFRSTNEGADVSIYIVDTGVRASHSAFAGRMGEGANFAARNGQPREGGGGLLGSVDSVVGGLLGGGKKEPEPGERPDWEDCNGHGTHVAGTAAGKGFGVAPAARIHAVRVLDCDGSGSTADVIAGVDWAAEHAQMPAVLNLSLGGGASRAMDEAVANAVKKGFPVVVAAGNENQDACEASPARESRAITVAASTPSDTRADFSNFGRCVDLFAPGTEILSAWHSGDDATKELQGTSMAAPHVAGAVALLLAENGEATPEVIAGELMSLSAEDRIGSVRGTPNRLLQVPKDQTESPQSGGLFR